MVSSILITGGCGFVGSNLALKLKNICPSLHVTCFDNLMRRSSELNLLGLKEVGIQFIYGDVRNKEDFEKILQIPFYKSVIRKIINFIICRFNILLDHSVFYEK